MPLFHLNNMSAELQNPPDGSRNMVILCKIKLINIYVYEDMNINYKLTKVHVHLVDKVDKVNNIK